jgi:hypothetical protein
MYYRSSNNAYNSTRDDMITYAEASCVRFSSTPMCSNPTSNWPARCKITATVSDSARPKYDDLAGDHTPLLMTQLTPFTVRRSGAI